MPLWVAYYRRALPRYLLVRQLLAERAIGAVTSIHIEVADRLATGERARAWRFDPASAGAGLFLDLASHGFDLLDFLAGPIADVAGFAVNTGGTYAAEDVTAAARIPDGHCRHGHLEFQHRAHLLRSADCPRVRRRDHHRALQRCRCRRVARRRCRGHPVRNPPHVHQPLVQTIVNELSGRGRCESTGTSGARA